MTTETKKYILNLLERELKIVRNNYVNAVADLRASETGRKLWNEMNPDDGVGGLSGNPYNVNSKKEAVERRIQDLNRAEKAYEDFMKVLINV